MRAGLRVPIPAAFRHRYSRTAPHRAWLDSLPALLSVAMDRWSLDLDLPRGAEPWSGHCALVFPVLHNGIRTALKIAYPYPEVLLEHHALALWDGLGAVRLLAADPQSATLLLERLDGDRSLQEAPFPTAIEVWGSVVRRISIEQGERPEWADFEHIAARAEQWTDELPASWEDLGRPFPRWLLEAALEVCQTRGAVGRRSGRDVLVHTDLHFRNIVAPLGDGWDKALAIDPQPMIGEAEFAVAPVLWNRLQDYPARNPERAVLDRVTVFCAAAGLDADRARAWSIVREVDNALSYAADPALSSDLQRSLWVASTLAGRALPGLPHPHQLSAPGSSTARR
ncbi:aminoglycoside phosphotransferase family protein [Pseudarthrobacter sp. PS3-L1]|uniref:aminoglycoside phosphotransferase family protein n=1 Tax=Pseudarthrobacter sp. PS3-L1 TaxID=3046207 RepID=UPI0024BBB3B3|nr:aminoglycoside phosphotransferase family protein [Pseudarthrobacter sp. PS3-L1]MDJ0321862.1 aminoglycoside phosphotransferase family protein [Pseudarthrobacter sp. PS3-L1]